jgi:hypothetical protein
VTRMHETRGLTGRPAQDFGVQVEHAAAAGGFTAGVLMATVWLRGLCADAHTLPCVQRERSEAHRSSLIHEHQPEWMP